MSVNDSVPMDPAANLIRDTVRQQLNLAIKDYAYFILNRPAWQVAAAAVAPPVVATATVTSKVKTTATSQLWVNGVVKSLTATDNLWDLTPDAANTLAIGSCRRYLLLWDGTTATTVVSVQPSTDVTIASAGTAAAALAACRFYKVPTGLAIVGMLSIANVTNVFTPGTTLLGAAGVTATYIDGPDANAFVASLVNP